MTPLHIPQGTTFRAAGRVEMGGAIVDLTGATARFQARADTESATALIDIAATCAGVTGMVSIEIPPATSSAWGAMSAWGLRRDLLVDGVVRSGPSAVWALEVTLASGETIRPDEGVLVVSREVVR